MNHVQIDNLEFIKFINAPVLKQLSMAVNNIYNCHSLNVADIKGIYILNLSNNYINELNLSRGKVQSNKMNIYL
jgi:hypothetical protein